MKIHLMKIFLMSVTFFVGLNASAEAKSYLRQYCPNHQIDYYCQAFKKSLQSRSDKITCCEWIGQDQKLATKYAPDWIDRNFGYPLELFDLCMLGPVDGGVVFCE